MLGSDSGLSEVLASYLLLGMGSIQPYIATL